MEALVTIAVVFDLDDTLTDWWTAISRAAGAVADDRDASAFASVVQRDAWSRRDDGAVHRAHWRVRVEPGAFWRQVLDADEQELAEVAERFVRELQTELYEDVIPALDELPSEVTVGILTNNPFAGRELERLDLTNRFSSVVSLDEDSIRKPNPEAFRRLCAGVACDAGDILYVGDSPSHDVEPALAHGMRAAWIDRFDDPWTPPSAVAHLSTLGDLVAVLRAS